MKRSWHISITLFAIATALLILGLAFTGCASKETPTPTPTKTPTSVPLTTATPTVDIATATPTPTPEPTQKVQSATSTPSPTPTHTVEPTPELIEMGPDINPLTGLKTDEDKLDRHPLAIKIPNYPLTARPQSGIGQADIVIEHEAEAYLTRFTAIFLANDPKPVGPIRSVRLVDAELVPIFKAVLVTSGGHPEVKRRAVENKAWAENGYKRVISPDEPFSDGGTGYRIPDKKDRYELTWYSDADAMWELCAERGINQRQDFYDMFIFSQEPPTGGTPATSLKVTYKAGASEVEYKYDAETQTYQRFDLGEPLIDELTGEQVAPANVVVIYVNHVDTDIAADEHDPNHTWYSVSIQLWGQGPAKMLRDGQVYDCTWVRENPQKEDDRLILRDSKGNQMPFHPGTTWIQLVRLDGKVTIE